MGDSSAQNVRRHLTRAGGVSFVLALAGALFLTLPKHLTSAQTTQPPFIFIATTIRAGRTSSLPYSRFRRRARKQRCEVARAADHGSPL